VQKEWYSIVSFSLLALLKWAYLKKRALHEIQELKWYSIVIFSLLASKMHITWIISHGFSPMDLQHHTPPLLYASVITLLFI
jgi:hypothetical protein